MEDDMDDIPQLPADTLQALQAFHAEKDARAKQFEDLRARAEANFSSTSSSFPADDPAAPLSMSLFGEDWNASQFWYTDATADVLARQLLDGATAATSIAIVSAPSVYVALRNLLAAKPSHPPSAGDGGGNGGQGTAGPEGEGRPFVRLFEFDERFAALGPEFVLYDFQQPLRLAAELKGRFDRILCDPPFLSEDCQTRTALTARWLAKSWATPLARGASAEKHEGGGGGGGEGGDGVRFITCTGERMAGTIGKLYGKIGVRTTTFEPEHSKGLSNEFWCYANYECVDWSWRTT